MCCALVRFRATRSPYSGGVTGSRWPENSSTGMSDFHGCRMSFDARGIGRGHDLFTVTGITDELAHDAPNPPFSQSYLAGSAFVVPVVQRVYYFDRANRRLMVYDGYQGDMPLVDNVVDLRIAYFVDGSPTSVSRPPDGEASCVFDAGSPPVPRLEDWGGGLHELASAQLTDGRVLDLARLTAARQLESDERYDPAVFGADTPQWRLFAHDFVRGLLNGPGLDIPLYLVVWVADDESDGDGNPEIDSNGQILIYAVALGTGGARQSVQARVGRAEAGQIRLLAWRNAR
jgi:hypothetical protein